MLIKAEKWIGPFQIGIMLERCFDPKMTRPPASGSAYVVTERAWRKQPSGSSGVLYVGGNTGKSARFRTRLGDLIADAFGFFSETTGHHSGGQHIHEWCRANGVNPLDLHLAWIAGTSCHRCLEIRLVKVLTPSLNRMTPSRCVTHPRTAAQFRAKR